MIATGTTTTVSDITTSDGSSSAIATGTTTTTSDTTENANPHETISGDFNGDGEVTVADAVLLSRFVSEDATLTKKEINNILNAEPDQDADGLVSIPDVFALLKKMNNA